MRLVDTLLQDTRYALRTLLKDRGFAAIAILSLALGIGANTAIFTLINAVLLRSLPVRAPEELVVAARNPDNPETSFNYPDYRYVRDHNRSFTGVAAYSVGGRRAAMTVPGQGGTTGPELTSVGFVSGNFFDLLGVTPAIGRVFTNADNEKEGAHPLTVLGYDFWMQRFGGQPDVLGKPIALNGSVFTVVGVSRAGFTGTNVGVRPDLYVPIVMLKSVERGVPEWDNRHFWWLSVIARLKPGVTRDAAVPEIDVLWKQILANDPERKPTPEFLKKGEAMRNRGWLLDGSGGYSQFRNAIRKPIAVLMVIAGLVLLIACANVAGLLLARAAARQREIAIRLAVGAGRARLMGQLMVETIVLAAAGGVAGVLFAVWGAHALVGMMPMRGLPPEIDLSPDWRLASFAFGVAFIAGLLCGLAPAIQATRPDLVAALKNEVASILGRVRFDLRRGLVVAQVAISLLLLIGTGLFIRSLQNLRALDSSFARENVLLAVVNPEQTGYKGQRLRDFYERLARKVENAPGVRSVAVAHYTPQAGMRWNEDLAVEGYVYKADEKPFVDFNSVSGRYFETMGIPLLLGRDFRDQDNPASTPDPDPKHVGPQNEALGPPAPVAIVNESFAKRFFGSDNPIGKRFSTGEKFDIAKSYEIVGVVRDVRYFDLRKDVEAMIYVPVWRLGAHQSTLCVRTAGDPLQLAGVIRRETGNLDPGVPVLQTLTMQQQYDSSMLQERVFASLCSFFGGLAVLLAAIGLYGVMAHSVARRYREIGIRMALGAKQGSVLWLVLRETVVLVGLGTAIGLPAAVAATRLVKSFLYGLTAQDPASIAIATAGLFVVTALAGYIPARRATRIEPMTALRYE